MKYWVDEVKEPCLALSVVNVWAYEYNLYRCTALTPLLSHLSRLSISKEVTTAQYAALKPASSAVPSSSIGVDALDATAPGVTNGEKGEAPFWVGEASALGVPEEYTRAVTLCNVIISDDST